MPMLSNNVANTVPTKRKPNRPSSLPKFIAELTSERLLLVGLINRNKPKATLAASRVVSIVCVSTFFPRRKNSFLFCSSEVEDIIDSAIIGKQHHFITKIKLSEMFVANKLTIS